MDKSDRTITVKGKYDDGMSCAVVIQEDYGRTIYFTTYDITFGIVKAPSVKRGHLADILTYLSKNGFSLAGVKAITFTPDLLARFYDEHVGHPYWGNIEKVMLDPAGCVAFMAMHRDGASVSELRKLLGESSNPENCAPNTIRGKFGGAFFGGDPSVYADNALHASDSSFRRETEIGLFYTEEEICQAMDFFMACLMR